MGQVITNAFEQYWQSSLAAEQPVVLDEFVLADIPNLDITAPIDPDTGLPPAGQIVYRQTVDQRGRVNSNAVAYSIVMDTTVGDFSFNAMFLRNKANGVIGMIVYKGRETKLKTDQTTGQTGNSLVKSMLMGYDQAAEATLTNVDAGTWQIDYAARLRGQDEDLRQLASQLYGHHTFIGDGFKVVQQDGGHQVTQGVAIVGGLRIELKQPEVIYPGTKPIGVWVDVHRAGSLLSEYQNHFTIITSVADLTDHVDGNGYQHYVAKLGTVQADNTVVDGRGQGGAGIVSDGIKSVTWVGFAGGADPTGANDSTAAFLAANATKRKIYVPSGTYKLTQDVVSDPLTSWEREMGASFSGSFRLRETPWLAGPNEKIFHYLERMSRNTFIGPTDGIGVFGTAHNDGAGSAGSAIGVAGLGYNDNTVGPGGSAWALYGTAIRNAGTTGSTHGMELDIANRGDENEIYPFNMFNSGQTHALWLGSGGELGGNTEPATLSSASAAIGIISNDGHPTKTARFLKGIIFQNDSLKGTDGDTGEGIAIAMANRHSLQWYNNANSRTSGITSQCVDAEKAMRINLSDVGVLFQKTTGGQTLLSVESMSSTPANFMILRAAISGNPTQIVTTGSDANISLLLNPKGTGSVDVNSTIAPQVANTYNVGTSLRPWAGGFTQTAFTVTSDERAKTVPLVITDAMLDAAAEVDFVQYQYLDRVEEKGVDGARWHFGAVAQRYVEAFARHGLDAHHFGFICYDEWDDKYVKVQTNEGEPEYIDVLETPAGSRYGIRYEEALALEAALQRRNYQQLLKRIEVLEAN